MGRYSLIAVNRLTGDKRVIKVKELNKQGEEVFKEKVDLSTIDKYTLKFSSESHLLEFLRRNNIINNDYLDLYISYNCNGIKRLPLVFSDVNYLEYFANKYNSKINLNDYEFIKFAEKVLRRCYNPTYLTFLSQRGHLNKYLEEHLTTYENMCVDKCTYSEVAHVRNSILTNLSGYKCFRGVLLGDYDYDNYKAVKDKILYIKDDEDDIDYSDIKKNIEEENYEELFNFNDLDELDRIPKEERKRLGLHF